MAEPELTPEEVLRAVVGSLPVDLACWPLIERPACAGRLLASLPQSTARRALEVLRQHGVKVGRIRTFLDLVHKSVENPTPELKEAVMTVLGVLDTPTPTWLLAKALADIRGTVAGLVSAHLDKISVPEAKRGVVRDEEVSFVLAVASAASTPEQLPDGSVAMRLFGGTLRLTSQFTPLRLAVNMFWPFVPSAETLLDRITETVVGELAQLISATPSAVKGTLQRKVTAETTAVRLVGMPAPVDFPVRIEFDLMTAERPAYLNNLSINDVGAHVTVRRALDKAYVKAPDGSTVLLLDGFGTNVDIDPFKAAAGRFPRVRSFNDVASWYAQMARGVVSVVRKDVAGLLSVATANAAAAERQYEPGSGAMTKFLDGSDAYIKHRFSVPEAGVNEPTVEAWWWLTVHTTPEYGRDGVAQLVRNVLGSPPKRKIDLDLPIKLARGIERALKKRFRGVYYVDVAALNTMPVTIRMKSITITAHDYAELRRKVGEYLDRSEAKARQLVAALGELARAPDHLPGRRPREETSRTSRPGGEEDQDMVPA